MNYECFRWYEGDIPIIAVGDAEMAKEVLIKQFHIFHEGKVRAFQINFSVAM